MSDAITVKSLTSADRDALLALDQAAFGFDARDLDPDADTAWIEWDRAYGAYRGDQLAAIYVVFSFEQSVPSAPPEPATLVPMAGLSWVAVHPDHRRRGLLSAMIRHHFTTVHEGGRGETMSGLFASEAAIYGRFGYGQSTTSVRYTLPAKTPLRLPRDLGDVSTRLEAADPAKHDAIVKQVYDVECRQRPGLTMRPPAMWGPHLQDPVSRRPAGAEGLKIIIAERDGRPTGYAAIRRTASWGERGPEGKVNVRALHAVDLETSFALWRRVLDFDLMAEVTTPVLVEDHPLSIWAGESGASTAPAHAFWTRIIDVPGALTGRGYASPVDVVLDITDAICPWNAGRWRLSADADGATCEPTTAPPDLTLDIRELGSGYLGGVTLSVLGAAGLVEEHTGGALLACSTAWRSPLLPATPYMF